MLALVYTGGHWLSDVLGGLCLGWALIETGRAIRTTRSQNYLRD
jgi:membrane-associated phospholipid phosphatase